MIFHLNIYNYLSKYLTFICTLCVISSDPISVYATFSTLQIFSIQLASNIQCSGVFRNFKWNFVIVSKSQNLLQCWPNSVGGTRMGHLPKSFHKTRTRSQTQDKRQANKNCDNTQHTQGLSALQSWDLSRPSRPAVV